MKSKELTKGLKNGLAATVESNAGDLLIQKVCKRKGVIESIIADYISSGKSRKFAINALEACGVVIPDRLKSSHHKR